MSTTVQYTLNFKSLYVDEGDVRLVGGRTNSEGNVEVFFNFTWRPVCDDSWDIRDGTVVCNSLGFPGADTASPDFGPVDRNLFLLDEVDCVGNEANILECPHSGVGNHDCFSFEAAGVICNRKFIEITQHFQFFPVLLICIS